MGEEKVRTPITSVLQQAKKKKTPLFHLISRRSASKRAEPANLGKFSIEKNAQLF